MTATFTATLLERLAPWVTAQSDPSGAHTAYLSALSAEFEQVFGLAMDQGFAGDTDYVPGWSILLDPVNCPDQWLPYLAQYVGAVLPTGASPATQRAIILAESGLTRGTLAAVLAAATRMLTGTQTILFRERRAADGSMDAYHAVLVYRPAQCPSVPNLIAAVETMKPAGIQITYIGSTGFPWDSAIHTWNADVFSWNAAASTQP